MFQFARNMLPSFSPSSSASGRGSQASQPRKEKERDDHYLERTRFSGSADRHRGVAQSVVGDAYYQAHGWPKFAAGLVVGLLVLLTGCGLNKNRPSGNNHTFFFIPVEMWGVLIFVFGVVASLSK